MADKLVAPMSSMDDVTVVKHYNARHMPLAGMGTMLEHLSPGVVKSFRNYHERVHAAGYEGEPGELRKVNHEHKKAR
jgi:hypothetical protein